MIVSLGCNKSFSSEELKLQRPQISFFPAEKLAFLMNLPTVFIFNVHVQSWFISQIRYERDEFYSLSWMVALDDLEAQASSLDFKKNVSDPCRKSRSVTETHEISSLKKKKKTLIFCVVLRHS